MQRAADGQQEDVEQPGIAQECAVVYKVPQKKIHQRDRQQRAERGQLYGPKDFVQIAQRPPAMVHALGKEEGKEQDRLHQRQGQELHKRSDDYLWLQLHQPRRQVHFRELVGEVERQPRATHIHQDQR